ncbi:MFS transporter- SP family- general alpha glucoside:H+ symporter [Apiospora arundinis]
MSTASSTQPQPENGGHGVADDSKGMASSSTTMLASEAKHAADAEQQMSLWTAMKLYPKAIGWSVLLSSTLIMEGYDLALLSALYASPPFNKKAV